MSSSKQARELLKMKEAIEEKKTSKHRFEGQMEQIVKKLKEKFNCQTNTEIKAKLKKISADIEKKESTLQEKLEELQTFNWDLERNYGWDLERNYG